MLPIALHCVSVESPVQVLLLEAGGEELVLSDLPFAYPALQLSPIDWQYKSEPTDSYCLGFKNHHCNWPRGKVIGGSSVINAMLYVRGNAKDYDNWREQGNPGKTTTLWTKAFFQRKFWNRATVLLPELIVNLLTKS